MRKKLLMFQLHREPEFVNYNKLAARPGFARVDIGIYEKMTIL